MTVSEFIAALQAFMCEHGDLPVIIDYDGYDAPPAIPRYSDSVSDESKYVAYDEDPEYSPCAYITIR